MRTEGAGEGLRDDDTQEGTSREAERVVYVLHPNCAIEEV